MLRIPPLNAKQLARFNLSFERNKTDACWEWKPRPYQRYGQFRLGDTWFKAHRIAWSLKHGDPGDYEVCHTCDNPRCVNPSHFFRGTHQDNMSDMAKKKRARPCRGTKHGRHKLTADQIKAVKQAHGTQQEIAERYGISQTHVSRIKSNKTWRHLYG